MLVADAFLLAFGLCVAFGGCVAMRTAAVAGAATLTGVAETPEAGVAVPLAEPAEAHADRASVPRTSRPSPGRTALRR
jgi:hypothetical protein